MSKFSLNCKLCGYNGFELSEYLSNGQKCINCGLSHVEVRYENLVDRLHKVLSKSNKGTPGMWRYYDLLPIRSAHNIVTAGEGDVSIDRWAFLEKFAQNYHGINCHVYAHRHDNNNATGSFKDLAGSLVASALKENKVTEYVVASTGNIGVAFARYISEIRGTLYAFIPIDSPKFKAIAA